MERCPLCRALLNGADTCRRCKAELATVRRVDGESQALTGAAMHQLALGDIAASRRLLRRAMDLHAAPEVKALWELMVAGARDHDEESAL
ncbi:MAG: hypothetical protein QOD93_2556 [Acetobacteraceae bacterium]|nr:hypothetical protein [Acetobacteraceae bacterium]